MADEIKAIICLTNMSSYASARQGRFIRSNQFDGLHVWENKAIPMDEFNEISDKILDDASRRGLHPHVRLVKDKAEPAKKKVVAKKEPKKETKKETKKESKKEDK